MKTENIYCHFFQKWSDVAASKSDDQIGPELRFNTAIHNAFHSLLPLKHKRKQNQSVFADPEAASLILLPKWQKRPQVGFGCWCLAKSVCGFWGKQYWRKPNRLNRLATTQRRKIEQAASCNLLKSEISNRYAQTTNVKFALLQHISLFL